MEFDDRQISILREVARNKCRVHFPIFANTFPIAYHYYRALNLENKNPVEYLSPIHRWGWEPIWKLFDVGEFDREKAHIFYSDEKSLEGYKSKIESEGGRYFESVAVTNYIPRVFFICHTASLDGLKEIDFEQRNILSLRDNFFSNIQRCDIFTDVPSIAREMEKEIKKHVDDDIVINTIDGFHPAMDLNREQDRLRDIYVYGAPMSRYLLSKKNHYIGLPFTPIVPENLLRTHICLISDDGDVDRKKIITILRDYHQRMYDVASSDSQQLLDVTWAYNRFSMCR
ncbi:hypothetical protein KJ925_05045, partial [Patescibacteria group bacterium]|nr:hypothetical protein [Patescibacteria group bacterium]